MAKRIHGCQAGICFIVLTLGIFISRLNAWMTLPEKDLPEWNVRPTTSL